MNVDVLLLGAGPASAATALALAPFCKVVLLEKRPQEAAARVSESLVSAARRVLGDLGVLESFLAERHQCWHPRHHLRLPLQSFAGLRERGSLAREPLLASSHPGRPLGAARQPRPLSRPSAGRHEDLANVEQLEGTQRHLARELRCRRRD